MEFAGRIALVTGGASGIGREVARQLSAKGAALAVADINFAGAEAVAAELVAAGGTAIAVEFDVADADQVSAGVVQTCRELGGLHILVHSAGIGVERDFLDTSLEEWQRIIDVDLTGTFLTCQAAAREMVKGGYGRIVNLSSTAGLVGSATSAVYSMTKGGVRLFTKSTAIEVRAQGHNIRCNSVHPGATESPMQDHILATSNMSPDEIKSYMETRNLLGRFGTARDIAKAILFLASNDSAFMTGSEVVVDGGYTAR